MTDETVGSKDDPIIEVGLGTRGVRGLTIEEEGRNVLEIGTAGEYSVGLLGRRIPGLRSVVLGKSGCGREDAGSCGIGGRVSKPPAGIAR